MPSNDLFASSPLPFLLFCICFLVHFTSSSSIFVSIKKRINNQSHFNRLPIHQHWSHSSSFRCVCHQTIGLLVIRNQINGICPSDGLHFNHAMIRMVAVAFVTKRSRGTECPVGGQCIRRAKQRINRNLSNQSASDKSDFR